MNPWVRNGFFYTCTPIVIRNNGNYYRFTKKLDIISYHMIKWLHGEDKLIEMANTVTNKG